MMPDLLALLEIAIDAKLKYGPTQPQVLFTRRDYEEMMACELRARGLVVKTHVKWILKDLQPIVSITVIHPYRVAIDIQAKSGVSTSTLLLGKHFNQSVKIAFCSINFGATFKDPVKMEMFADIDHSLPDIPPFPAFMLEEENDKIDSA